MKEEFKVVLESHIGDGLSAVEDRVEIRMRLKCSERHYKPSTWRSSADGNRHSNSRNGLEIKITLGFQEWRIDGWMRTESHRVMEATGEKT